MMRREVTEPHWWDRTNLHWSVTQQIKKYGSVGSATTLNHPDVIIVLFVSTFESKFSLLNMYIWWYTKNGRFIVSFMHFDLRWEVHIENGPSLCVGGQLCWGIELQVLPSLLGMLAHYVSIEIF